MEEIWPDQGNLFADPMFSDTLFHLQTGSPCIDAGDPTDDFSREPSPNGERINMGRYGNTEEATIGVNGEPIILSLSATSGLPEGGIQDTVRGNFLGASAGSITFGGLPAAIAYWSDTLVICTVPAHAAGKVDVSAITAAAKTDVLTYGFTYEGALSLGVPSDYPTIQQAINVAQAGDTVLVAPGVYSGIGNYNLEFFGKAIILTSEAGPEQTIIDATGADYGLYLHDGESRQTLISGFSVRHADEGGIYLAVGASPTVINCIFEEQQSTFSHGVSISGSNPAPLFQDCIIRNNVNNTSSGGAGIYATGSVTGAVFQNCLISNNQANSSFAKGGGFYSSGASPLFVNCTIVENHAGSDGGGLYAGTLNMRNSIVWGNTSASGAASIFITGTNAVTYTDVEGGWPGTGNINDDPIFLNPSLGDYHLHPSSPCIDAGDPADDFSREPQPNGGRINMGFYGNTEEATASVSDLALSISLIINLQGAYDPVEGLMRDNLRTSALLPLSEPYTGLGYMHLGGGDESVQQTVFGVGGMDAIVDWVFLEIRDKSDFALIIATRSALLQRDGDVVDVDGLSPVSFSNLPADDYYLVVKHRNHLGVMSAAPVALSNTTTIVDFTSDLNDVFGASNGIATLSDGTLGLFSGDFNRNGQVQNTDYNALLETLGTAGYAAGDLDLNSQIQNTDLQLNLIPNIGKGQPFPQ